MVMPTELDGFKRGLDESVEDRFINFQNRVSITSELGKDVFRYQLQGNKSGRKDIFLSPVPGWTQRNKVLV